MNAVTGTFPHLREIVFISRLITLAVARYLDDTIAQRRTSRLEHFLDLLINQY